MRQLGRLVGCLVTRVCLDYQVGLLLAGDGVDATLVVESAMTLTVAGSAVDVEPDTGENYAALVQLLRRTLTSVGVDADETLRIGFGDDVSLVVHPDPRYQSWELS